MGLLHLLRRSDVTLKITNSMFPRLQSFLKQTRCLRYIHISLRSTRKSSKRTKRRRRLAEMRPTLSSISPLSRIRNRMPAREGKGDRQGTDDTQNRVKWRKEEYIYEHNNTH